MPSTKVPAKRRPRVNPGAEWRELCRSIVILAMRLQHCEAKAREMLARGGFQVAMPLTVGSGLSLLGIGDPLAQMRREALKAGVIGKSDVFESRDQELDKFTINFLEEFERLARVYPAHADFAKLLKGMKSSKARKYQSKYKRK